MPSELPWVVQRFQPEGETPTPNYPGSSAIYPKKRYPPPATKVVQEFTLKKGIPTPKAPKSHSFTFLIGWSTIKTHPVVGSISPYITKLNWIVIWGICLYYWLFWHHDDENIHFWIINHISPNCKHFQGQLSKSTHLSRKKIIWFSEIPPF